MRPGPKWESDLVMDLVGLIVAVLASLASGVLVAYAACAAFFRAFATRPRALASPAPAISSAMLAEN